MATNPSEAPDTSAEDMLVRRWLRWGLILLIGLLVLPCLLIGGVLLAARAPDGVEIGNQALLVTVDWQPQQLVMQLNRREIAEYVCYYQETVTILFDPLEVRRVPGCQCAVSGPNYSYEMQDCGIQ